MSQPPLPGSHECDRHRSYYARLDIGNTPSLQLVLPARKEAVENAGLVALRAAVELEIYKTIAASPSRRLSHHDWLRAAELGVVVVEAEQTLRSWNPQVADSNSGSYGAARIVAANAILTPMFSPSFSQPLARAAAKHPFRGQMAEKVPAYAGYAWYDALTTILDARFIVTCADGSQITIDDEEESADLPGHTRVQAIEAQFDVATGTTYEIIAIPADVAFGSGPDIWDGLDAARIVWTSDGLSVDDLADLLDAAYFCSSDDRECDSWDTQHRAFEDEALALAASLLLGEDAAAAARIQRLLRDNLWLVPAGRRVTISIIDRKVEVALVPIEQAA